MTQALKGERELEQGHLAGTQDLKQEVSPWDLIDLTTNTNQLLCEDVLFSEDDLPLMYSSSFGTS